MGQRCIAGRIAEQCAVVHAQWAHDLTWVEGAHRVETVFYRLESLDNARAKHGLVKLGAYQAVTMLSGMRTFVFTHHLEGLFRNGAHLFSPTFLLHVEYRTHMQAAHRGVRIPSAARAVLGEDRCQAVSIFRQVFERHCTVLDEGYGLALAFHRHDDVEARLAHIPDLRLLGTVDNLGHRIAVAEIAEQLTKLCK